MYKKITGIVSLLFVSALALGISVPASARPNNNNGNVERVVICEANRRPVGTYTQNTVNVSSLFNNNGLNSRYSNSIIPPVSSKSFAGQNWTLYNQAVYNNDCKPVVTVVPAVVTFVAPPCDANVLGTYTITATTGVTYKVGGSAVAAGKYTAANGATVTVVAVANKGYFIDSSSASSWTYTFNRPSASSCALGANTGNASNLPKTSGDATTGMMTAFAAGSSVLAMAGIAIRRLLTRGL